MNDLLKGLSFFGISKNNAAKTDPIDRPIFSQNRLAKSPDNVVPCRFVRLDHPPAEFI